MSSHLIQVNIKQIFSPNTVANLWIAKLKTLQCVPCIVKNVGASDIEIYQVSNTFDSRSADKFDIWSDLMKIHVYALFTLNISKWPEYYLVVRYTIVPPD